MKKLLKLFFSICMALAVVMNTTPVTAATTYQPATITESGWTMDTTGKFFTFAVKINNPNAKLDLNEPNLKVNVYNASGKKTSTYSYHLNSIKAGDTISYGETYYLDKKKAPARVEFLIANKKSSYKKGNLTSASELVINNANETVDGNSIYFKGTVTNNSKKAIKEPVINITLYKNGSIVGGHCDTDYVTIKKKDSADYEIQMIDAPAYDSVEVMAIPKQ